MIKVTIDPNLCTRCGACIATCPENVLVDDGKGLTPKTTREAQCVVCGHCVAICPHGALAHGGFPEGTVQEIDRKLAANPDQLMELLRARRSVRVFEDEEVDRESVEQLIEAARLAPSAHNLQTTEYIVVTDAAVLTKMAESTAAFFTKLARQLRNPISRLVFRLLERDGFEDALWLLPEFEEIAIAVARGEDMILHGAPCVVVFHAKRGLNFPDTNANLSQHNAALMCEAMGLGSFYLGYLVGACKRSKALRALLGIPKSHDVFAAMAIGHPRYKFSKWVERNKPKVDWR